MSIDILEETSEIEEKVEALPEDVQDALGINKPKSRKIKEVDYISELENGLDDFDGTENDSKSALMILIRYGLRINRNTRTCCCY